MSSPTAIRAGRAFVELFADDSMLVRTLRHAEAQVVRFGAQIQAIGRRLMTLGLALNIPLAASIRTFAKFDDMMRAVKASVGANEGEFERLTEKAKLLGRTTSFTATQVAAAMLELGRAGFDPNMIDVAIASLLSLARATGAELPTATEIAVNAMYSFELGANDMQRVCDVMVAAANGAAMTLTDLGDSMSYCAPIAKEYGLTLEDTCKLIGALSNYGIKASQAGTTFRRILTNLADADIQKRLRSLGVAVVDMNTGKMREVSAVLRDLGYATAWTSKDKKLTLFKELFGLWAIAGGAKLTVAQFDYLIKLIDNAGGKASATAREMDAGIGGSLRRMWSVIEGVAIAVGGSLAPSLQKLTDWFVRATSGAIAFIDKNQELVIQAAKSIAVIIGVGAGLFTLGLGFLAVGKSIAIVATTIASIARAVLSVYRLLDNIINAVRFAVGSFASAFRGIASVIGGASSFVASFVRTLFSVFGSIGRIVFTVMTTIGSIAVRTIIAIVRDLLFLGRVVAAVVSFLAPIITTMLSLVARAVVAAVSLITSVLTPVFTAVINAMTPLISTCFTTMRLIAAALSGALIPLMNIVASAFASVGTMIVAALSGTFSYLGGMIASMLAPVVTALASFGAAVGGVLGAVFSVVASFVGSMILSIIWGISAGLASALTVVGIFVAGVVQLAGMAITAVLLSMHPILIVLATIAAAADVVWLVASNMSRIGAVIASIFNGLVQIVSRCFNMIVTVLMRLAGFIVQPILACFARIITGIWNRIRSIGAALSATVGNVVTSVRTAFSNAWNGLVNLFQSLFHKLNEILNGFKDFFIQVFENIGTAVDWLREQFGYLCSFATETYSVLVETLGRGDIEAALQLIWATIQLIWVKGATSILSVWYWVVETLQTAWATCVYKISEILTPSWYGVQQFWAETVYTMSTLWTEFSDGVISRWKRSEQAIAQGIGWIMAKMQGLNADEMARTIAEDYHRQSQQRESEKQQRLSDIQTQRDKKTSSLQSEKEGTLDILKEDFEKAAGVRNAAYDAKLAAQEAELEKAKSAYNEAIDRAKNPPVTFEDSKTPSLSERLKRVMQGFSNGASLSDKVSVTGSFSAAAIQSMGVGSVMDRVAKATEKSEKHLSKLVNKDTNPDKQEESNKESTPEFAAGRDDLAMRELKQHTRYLRDISEKTLSAKFA
ncbi:MAG: phage tail tape measure protein [Planctomycetaceae bacterium]|jgi:TP901 family phage tail tape measure protein|nr:phage tail tape measure protein [Planctomycetaceae bacterium]